MREIKFRAWDKQANCMIGGGGMQLNATTGTLDSLPSVVVMQYTELHDKNGREIYEGDIIVAEYHWEKPHMIELPEDYYWFSEVALEDGDMEVIGNIYENPELLRE